MPRRDAYPSVTSPLMFGLLPLLLSFTNQYSPSCTPRCSITACTTAQTTEMMANIAKVYGLATLRQKEEGVELGKEVGRWLMNRDEDSLSDFREFTQEAYRVDCSLAIETRSRFVEEDQDTGLSYELNTNCGCLKQENKPIWKERRMDAFQETRN